MKVWLNFQAVFLTNIMSNCAIQNLLIFVNDKRQRLEMSIVRKLSR